MKGKIILPKTNCIKEKLIRQIFKIMTLFFTIIIATNCSMGNYIEPVAQSNTKFIKPTIGKINICSLGEPIVTTGYGHSASVIKVNETEKQTGFYGTIFVYAGIYELISSNEQYEYYYPTESGLISFVSDGYTHNEYNYQIRLSRNKEIAIIVDTGSILDKDHFTKNLKYEKMDGFFIEKSDSFQQTMIYLGKNGNILIFSYREFSNNLIRDSFTTEITYDLFESNIIGFKNFKAEIIKATNSKLTYKIIATF